MEQENSVGPFCRHMLIAFDCFADNSDSSIRKELWRTVDVAPTTGGDDVPLWSAPIRTASASLQPAKKTPAPLLCRDVRLQQALPGRQILDDRQENPHMGPPVQYAQARQPEILERTPGVCEHCLLRDTILQSELYAMGGQAERTNHGREGPVPIDHASFSPRWTLSLVHEHVLAK